MKNEEKPKKNKMLTCVKMFKKKYSLINHDKILVQVCVFCFYIYILINITFTHVYVCLSPYIISTPLTNIDIKTTLKLYVTRNTLKDYIKSSDYKQKAIQRNFN